MLNGFSIASSKTHVAHADHKFVHVVEELFHITMMHISVFGEVQRLLHGF